MWWSWEANRLYRSMREIQVVNATKRVEKGYPVEYRIRSVISFLGSRKKIHSIMFWKNTKINLPFTKLKLTVAMPLEFLVDCANSLSLRSFPGKYLLSLREVSIRVIFGRCLPWWSCCHYIYPYTLLNPFAGSQDYLTVNSSRSSECFYRLWSFYHDNPLALQYVNFLLIEYDCL